MEKDYCSIQYFEDVDNGLAVIDVSIFSSYMLQLLNIM